MAKRLAIALVALAVLAFGMPTPAAAAGSTVTTNVATIAAANDIVVSWSVATPHPGNWVALYRAGTPDSARVRWSYVGSAATGSLAFFISPLDQPGTYEFRLFYADSWTLLATSATFAVTAPDVTVTAAQPSFAADGYARVSWANANKPTTTDLMTLYPSAATNDVGNRLAWAYTGGTSSGSLELPVRPSVAPGLYEFRLFWGLNNTALLGRSAPFRIDPPSVPLTVPSSVHADSVLSVTWASNAFPSFADWMAVFRTGAPNDAASRIMWKYTGAAASGTASFDLRPTFAPGSYQVRMFSADSWLELGRSDAFEVTAPAVPMSATPTVFGPGATALVSWSDHPFVSTSDWIGLYPLGAPDDYAHRLAMLYTGGGTAGTRAMTVPVGAPPAPYEFRLYSANTLLRLGTTGKVGVPLDETPPLVAPQQTPPANADGWNNGDVSLRWGVADPESGIASTTGCDPVTLSAETAGTTITCMATNGVDLRAAATATVRIDRTAPSISTSRTPAPVNGWNSGDVTVRFSATDALSGVRGAATLDVTVGGEGTDLSASASFADLAGNTASAVVTGINIDRTPPTTSVVSGAPTRSLMMAAASTGGWSRGPVTVTLSAADALSGLGTTEVDLDGAGWQPYAAPLVVSGDGIHTLLYRSTDRAGNVEAATAMSVRIDATPPEAVLAYDPAANDVVVSGRDALSGMASVTSSAVPGKKGEQRTYVLADVAGNTLTLVMTVSQHGGSLQAQVLSLQYNDAPAQAVAPNSIKFVSGSAAGRGLIVLDQQVEVATAGQPREVDAVFSSWTVETTVVAYDVSSVRRVTIAGLALVRVVTDHGVLLVEVPELGTVTPDPVPGAGHEPAGLACGRSEGDRRREDGDRGPGRVAPGARDCAPGQSKPPQGSTGDPASHDEADKDQDKEKDKDGR